MPDSRRTQRAVGDYRAQNGHTAIVVAYALGGAYIGITNDVREFPGGERAQIKVSPDQAREIARTLLELADMNTSPPSEEIASRE